ncbi:MAG: AgmX/PglI C-terminal domain-containing protein, partial [Myxococcota bacterium]
QQKQAAPPPPPPPRETKQSPPPAEDDLEAELFGTKSSGSSSSRRTDTSSSEQSSSSRRGYIPPEPGRREQNLPREVSRGDIMQVVSSKRGQLRNCVSQQRAADPDASGTVVMGWRIQPNGTPSNIRVKSREHQGTVMAQCLTQVIRTMRFPRYGGPQMSEIEFPFQF